MDKHVKIVNNKKIVTLNDGREFIIENTNLNKFASDWVDYIERVIYKHKYYK
jgi:hypothetical protein